MARVMQRNGRFYQEAATLQEGDVLVLRDGKHFRDITRKIEKVGPLKQSRLNRIVVAAGDQTRSYAPTDVVEVQV